MSNKYIAADFGAGSGRILVGYLHDRKLQLKETHRFENEPLIQNGHIYWDFNRLTDEMVTGIEKSLDLYKNIGSIGIDTWGVDFGLLNEKDELVNLPYCYRDSRTDGIMEKVFDVINKKKLFHLTGNQLMQINTLFQLYSMKLNNPDDLNKAKTILMMPDLFNFYLTGKKNTEYTIASTSQLFNPFSKKWNKEIFDIFDLHIDMMAPIIHPGKEIGSVNINSRIDGHKVIAVGSHDTASAIAAVPSVGDDWAFISSGTWSLIGTELDEPVVNEESLQAEFTNEAGINNSIRFLKNVTGMWLFEECIKEWDLPQTNQSYNELIKQAEKADSFKAFIDPDAPVFLHPESMVNEISNYCKKTNQQAPQTKGEFVRIIFESLALKYRHIIKSMEQITNKSMKKIHIVGGGCQNALLNQFTANSTGLKVFTGPVEATSLGNILVQMIADDALNGINEGRKLIESSFDINIYEPKEVTVWDKAYEDYKDMIYS